MTDAVVLGSAPDQLVAAALLAKAGRKVVVLEEDDTLGGPFRTEELLPGHRVDSCAHDIGFLAPSLVAELELARHGLALIEPEATAFTPIPGGGSVTLWRDPARTAAGLAARSPRDAERWPTFAARMHRLAGFLGHLYRHPAPDLISTRPADLLALLGAGLRLRGLGRTDMMELLRILPMPVADLLDEWFEDEALKATLAAGGLVHLMQGPRSGGTTFQLLHHHVGRPPGAFRARTTARGGVGALVAALAAAARTMGAEIRSGVAVHQVIVKDGRATGVALAGGEEIPAAAVLSGLSPRSTCTELVDPGHFDPAFLHAVRCIKCRGVMAKVNLALDRLPTFTALPEGGAALQGVISIGATMAGLEEAYNAAKYREVSERPTLEVVIPTLADPSLAPAGRHTMSIAVQCAPYHLAGGWNADQREALGNRVVALLAEHAPNLPDLIRRRQVLTPLDLEERYGLPEGHLYHGEQTLDQILFMRPVAGWANAATPLPGLFLCGPMSHPGGGIAGGAGVLTARAVAKG